MKAVVFHGIADIQLDTVPEPEIRHATDAIIRLTSMGTKGIGEVGIVGMDAVWQATGRRIHDLPIA